MCVATSIICIYFLYIFIEITSGELYDEAG